MELLGHCFEIDYNNKSLKETDFDEDSEFGSDCVILEALEDELRCEKVEISKNSKNKCRKKIRSEKKVMI